MSDQFSASTELDVSRPTGQPNALLSFDLLASASLELPGLRANIEKLGASVAFSLRLDRQGNAGLIDCVLIPREPRGMGAELQVPPFSGGGYLEKVGNKELRGAFAASLGVIQVSALGVLGLHEFSMLVLLAGEFMPPLQLSFGFTLVGVGGLVGINRRVDDNQMTAAASSGDLSHLLFPRDPVAEAPRLLDVLSRCFPYEDGGMIIGPMVKVGWGTPTIISATLAVIVSTADARTVILGRLAITLPFEAIPLINIEALVKGDVDQNGVRIDATLANSHIVGIPIGGELRLRLIASPKPLFALAVGGFYPGYPVPDGMAGMRRLSATLSPSPIYHIRLEAYAAITTASVQFGARLELTIGFDGFGIHGFGQFDAFIMWEPYFAFATRLTASVSIECADFDVGSITLHGEFAGPAPWRFQGGASFSILFWDIDIDLPMLEWGPKPETLPPPPDPLESLSKALKRPEHWTAVSAAVPQMVILRGGPGSDTVVHPLGVIGFRQRSVPLNTEIKRSDGALLPRPVTMRVTPVDAAVQASSVSAEFVPSQFFDQDENARLTQTGYVDLPAGLDIRRADIIPPEGAVRHCDYEVKQLRAERIWADTRHRLESMTLIRGVSDRFSLKPEPLVHSFDPYDPHMTVAPPSAAFTDAAGRPLSKIAAWELEL